MKAIDFLEQLAHATHHDKNINALINQQPIELKDAYLHKNTSALKKQISDEDCFAHESHVIQSLIYDFGDHTQH